MIVRISGQGQYTLDDNASRRLDEIDSRLTKALRENREPDFRSCLAAAISLVRDNGKEVDPTRVVPSDVIIPPDDITLSEAQEFFTDEGLMEPLRS